jgi:hypothetical protein
LSSVRELDESYETDSDRERRLAIERGDEDSEEGDDWLWQTYGHLISVDKVAGEDPLKWDDVTRMPVIKFLNALSFMESKRIYREEQAKAT